MRLWTRAMASAACVSVCAACQNAGEGRVLGLTAVGVVRGLVFFDANGTREADAGDDLLEGVGVRLVVAGTVDTIAGGSSNVQGVFSLANVPVGDYQVVVDPATVADTAEVVGIEDPAVRVGPNDSVVVNVTISFPFVTVGEARTLAIGEKVFIEGVALNDRDAFGDATVHLADTSGTIRATRVRRVPLSPGDSVRLRGTIAARNGQPTLDDVTPIVLAISEVPPANEVSSADAASANDGALDAALAIVRDADIAATSTANGDFVMTVDDGSGSLDVVLDEDIAFDLAPLVPAAVVTVTGVLVPEAAAGPWVLKPRAPKDVRVQ